MNISDNGGHYEQRFRYTCKARIPDPGLLEVGRQRIEMRYCSSDGSTGCSTDGEGQSGGEWAMVKDGYWPLRLKPFLLRVCFRVVGRISLSFLFKVSSSPSRKGKQKN